MDERKRGACAAHQLNKSRALPRHSIAAREVLVNPISDDEPDDAGHGEQRGVLPQARAVRAGGWWRRFVPAAFHEFQI